MSDDGRIIAEHNGYELRQYISGECRIEHPASGTCGEWMTDDETRALIDNPAEMAEWALDGDMGVVR